MIISEEDPGDFLEVDELYPTDQTLITEEELDSPYFQKESQVKKNQLRKSRFPGIKTDLHGIFGYICDLVPAIEGKMRKMR